MQQISTKMPTCTSNLII